MDPRSAPRLCVTLRSLIKTVTLSAGMVALSLAAAAGPAHAEPTADELEKQIPTGVRAGSPAMKPLTGKGFVTSKPAKE